MASRQSAAVRALYERWTVDRLDGRPMDPESWGDLTAEPRGVDYVETAEPGTSAMWLLPHGAAADRVLLCMHGGGFVAGSIYTHRKLYGHLAKAVGARALLFRYLLAPERVHPAQVDAATAVYRWLLGSFAAEHIAFVGDSSGGGLTITTQLNARAAGLPAPAAAMALSPWVDMEVGGESFRTNALTDGYFYRDLVDAPAANFLGPDGDRGSPTWFNGRETCLAFLATVIGSPGDWRMAPMVANAHPAAFAHHHGVPFGLAVLTATTTGISRVTVFPES